jgi:hypothetical protein
LLLYLVQHLLIQCEEHPAHDQKNKGHLLSNKRRNQFTTYQEQVSYSDYFKLLLASLPSLPALQLRLDRFLCHAFITHRHLPFDIAHCHRHSQNHKGIKKTLINLLKPTGYVMHHQFNIQQLYVLLTLYLCVLYLSENKQRLVPLKHKLIGFYNRDEKCLQRSTDWVFK